MSIDQSSLASLILIISSISAGFVSAFWIALIIWTYRDIRDRTRDRFAQILAAVLVFLLFLPGWIVYLILRPQKTLDEEYRQLLEEESLLQNIEEQRICPGCERQIETEWIICPTCQTRLRKVCLQCGKVLDLGWNICPYCCRPVPGMRKGSIKKDPDTEEISSGKDLEG
jgi:RNA polymerase subunit RPABC4/transcription elongation factor Spt4